MTLFLYPLSYDIKKTALSLKPERDLGYQTEKVETRVFKNKPASIKVYLEESTEMLNTVDINVARLQRKTKVNTAVVSLNPKNIETFSAGGDPDLMKALAVLKQARASDTSS